MFIPPTLASIHERLPGCCYPCSCSDDCLQIGNCCLDKLADFDEFNNDLELIVTSMTDNIRAECVPPNALSYTDEAEKYINKATYRLLGYRMIKMCFIVDSPPSVVHKCTDPNPEVIDEAVPVSSAISRLIYFNRYCAQCNNETDVLPWKVTIGLNTFFVGFCDNRNYSGRCIPVSNDISILFQEVVKHVTIREYAQITYNPPDSMENHLNMVCLPRTGLYTTTNKCKGNDNELQTYSSDLLHLACSTIWIPFLFGFWRAFNNVFCAICYFGHLERAQTNAKLIECGEGFSRSQFVNYMGLLKYSVDEDETETSNQGVEPMEKQSPCGCFGIKDPHQNSCRPLYCPDRERKRRCLCVPVIDDLNGKLFSIHLKLTLADKADADTAGTTNGQGENLLRSMQSLLHGMSKRLTIQNMFLLTKENSRLPYYHAIIVAKTPPNLDASDFLCHTTTQLQKGKRINIGRSKYSVSMTSSFGIKRLDELHMVIVPTYFEEFKDSSNLFKKFERLAVINNFTKLGCCKYVMLGPEEVFANKGELFLNVTGNLIPDVYWHQDNGGYIGICEDDYSVLAKPHGHVSGTSGYVASLKTLSCLLGAMLILRFI